jgi:uncharacterized protein YbbC (DUF1343 family)
MIDGEDDTSSVHPDLTIIPMEGWERHALGTDRVEWIPPSPNIPDLTAIVYPETAFQGQPTSRRSGTGEVPCYRGSICISK